MTQVKEHDFIEVEYTGKLADGTVFDTTSKQIAEENGINKPNAQYGPVIVCIGEKQLIPGLDDELIGKEPGEYTISLKAEDAFGKKDPKKIRIVPARAFKKQNIIPQPGLQVNMDGSLARIIRMTGGRVIVDYNHPVAGRDVVYEIKINKIITDKKEQIKGYLSLSLGIDVEVDVKDDNATIKFPTPMPEGLKKSIEEKISKLTSVKKVEIETLEQQSKKDTTQE